MGEPVDEPPDQDEAADAVPGTPCPFCQASGDGDGDSGDDECPHTIGIAHLDSAEAMDDFPTWFEIDELASRIDRLTVGGREMLDGLAGTPRFWWLTRHGEGAGASARMAGIEVIARRFGFETRTVERDDLGGGSDLITVMLTQDPDATRPHVTEVLARVLLELTTVGRRLHLPTAEDEDGGPARRPGKRPTGRG